MRILLKANAGLLIAGIATFIMMGAGQALLGPALPVFVRDFQLTEAQGGLFVSAFWVGCAIGVAGMYLRGQGVTPRHALTVMVAGAALIAAGLGWWTTVLGSAVFGAGYGVCTVVFNPRVLKAFGARGTAMVSLLNATFGIGAILSPLVFVALGQNPQLAFGLCAGFALAIWLIAGPASRGEEAATPVARGPFRPSLPFLLFAVSGIGLEACLGGLGPTALIGTGMTEVQAAQTLSTFFVAFLGARIALAMIAHLFAPFQLFTGAMAMATVFALVAAMVSPGIGFVGIGFCAAMFFPTFFVTASRRLGDDPRVTPLIVAAGLVGGVFGPILIGAIMGGLGERGFFWLIAGIAGVTTLAALLAGRRLSV